jgi:hypothetical protein
MPRHLRCKNFQDIRAELARLGDSPVETTGKWSYFQMLSHLAKAVEGSMKGTRREIPWWKRHLLGPVLYRLFSARGYIPEGIKGPPPDRIEGNAAEARILLEKALENFEKSEGPYSDHPIMGPLNKQQWLVFHSMHFANHVRHTRINQ